MVQFHGACALNVVLGHKTPKGNQGYLFLSS